MQKQIWNFKDRLKERQEGVPAGSVAKNPPANLDDAGWIPGLGRSYMLWSN